MNIDDLTQLVIDAAMEIETANLEQALEETSPQQINEFNATGDTLLMVAAGFENISVVKLLLSRGADVSIANDIGCTALWGPVYNMEIAQLLIDAGADVNAQNVSGGSILMYAAFMSRSEFLELLIAHGAHVNHRNKMGRTALMKATIAGSERCVQILLDAGANKEINSIEGETARDIAIEKGFYKIADMLK